MKAGWYYVPGDGRLRYWDGVGWTDAYREPEGPEPYAADADTEIPALAALPSKTEDASVAVPKMIVGASVVGLLGALILGITAWRIRVCCTNR